MRITANGLLGRGYAGLLGAIGRYIGSVPRARRLAGLPDPTRRESPIELWNEDRVVHEIRARQRANLPLAPSKVPPKLRSAAVDHCGSWRNAIEMAGLDYHATRLHSVPLSRDEVLERLRAAARANRRGVGSSGISRLLQRGARRLFGSIRNAVIAAGLEPTAVLRRVILARQDIPDELRRLARERPDMTLSELGHTKSGYAAIKYYGRLSIALARAGIQGWPRSTRRTAPPRDDLLPVLRLRHRRGDSLRLEDVTREHQRLVDVARERFGSWRAALKAAGVPVPGPKRRRWSREEILQEIRRRHHRGEPLDAIRIYVGLRQDARIYFGDWPSAVAAAGLDYEALRHRKWDRRKLFAAMRASARAGRTGVGPHGFIKQKLAVEAQAQFGSLRAAIIAAGLDPARVLRRQPRTVEELAADLRRMARKRPRMTMTQLHHTAEGSTLVNHFGSLTAALDALGIRGWPRRLRSPLPSRDELLAALRRRHQRAASMRQDATEHDDGRLRKAAAKHFGTWRAAMAAAGLGALVSHRPVWTDATILAALKARHARGAPMNASIVKQEEPRLASAVANHFGSMSRALRAARLPAPAPLPPSRRRRRRGS